MKTILRLISALLLLGVSSQVSAICSYRLLKAPNGKLVLILGDVHLSDMFKPHLERFIKEINSIPLKEPLPLIIELEEASIKNALLGKVAIVGSFKTLVDAWYKKNRQVQLDLFDPRGVYSEVVKSIRDGMYDDVIAQCITEADMQAYPNVKTLPSQDAWKQVKKNAGQLKDPWNLAQFTVGGFLNDLKEKCATLRALAEPYKEHESVYTLMLEEIEQFSQAVTKIEADLAAYDPKLSLWEAIFTSCLASKTTIDLMKFYDNLDTLYGDATDYRFYDLHLLDKILRRVEDDFPVCLILGESHAQKLYEYLNMIPGWNPLGQPMILYESVSCYRSDRVIFPQFGGALEVAIKVLLASVKDDGIKKKEPSIKVEDKACAGCAETEHLKICTRCREVRYCSSECQEAAWKEHKKVCKKITVKQ